MKIKTYIIIPRESPEDAFILQGTENQIDQHLLDYFNEDQDEDDKIDSIDDLPDSMAVDFVESSVTVLGKKRKKK